MKTVRDTMTPDVVTVHPASTVKTATVLLKGHHIGALPVVNGEALIGLIEFSDILGADPAVEVAEIMNRDFVVVSPDILIQEAAEVMAKSGVTRLLVEEDGSLLGIVTHSDIIPELGKSFDPLTELPWSDTLREWAQDALSRGEEISIVFFDIDTFGKFNKTYGHVMGDTVLKSLTTVLKGLENSESDILCRMGGDEFVICTVRSRQQADELALSAAQSVSELRIEGLDEALSISFGVSGGRRTKERETTHYAATIDDLLTRASQDCTKMKRQKRAEAEQPANATAASTSPEQPAVIPSTSRRLKIQEIAYTASEADISVRIKLSSGEQSYESQMSGYAHSRSLARLAAEACAGAIRTAIPAQYHVAIEDVTEFTLPGGEGVIVSTVLLGSQREINVSHGLATIVGGDIHRAAAASVLSAINRPLANLLD